MNLTDIEKLHKQGKIRGFKVSAQGSKAQSAVNQAASGKVGIVPVGLQYIKSVLDKFGIRYVTEHQFVQTRKFRFDIAILSLKVACEYEGLVATGKKGGHQTKTHYTNNCTKYNLASIEGWTLLRYTYKNYKDFDKDLQKLL